MLIERGLLHFSLRKIQSDVTFHADNTRVFVWTSHFLAWEFLSFKSAYPWWREVKIRRFDRFILKSKSVKEHTSSLISKLGLLGWSSGGMSEPRRLFEPEPGASEPLRLGSGVLSRLTSILGASPPGALISGTDGFLGYGKNTSISTVMHDSFCSAF